MKPASANQDRRNREKIPRSASALRIVLWVIAAVVLPGGFATFAVVEMRKDTEQKLQSSMQRSAHLIAEDLSEYLGIAVQLIEQSVKRLQASAPAPAAVEDEVRQHLLGELTRTHAFGPAFKWVLLVNEEGRIVAQSSQSKFDDARAGLTERDLRRMAEAQSLLRLREVVAVADGKYYLEAAFSLDDRFADAATKFLEAPQRAELLDRVPLRQPGKLAVEVKLSNIDQSVRVFTDGVAGFAATNRLAFRLMIGATLLFVTVLAAAWMSTRRIRAFADAIGSAHAMQAAILQGSDVMILSLDRFGVIQAQNVASQRLTGYSDEEVIGILNAATFIVPRAQPGSAQAASDTLEHLKQRAYRAGRTTGIMDVLSRDGSRRPIFVNLSYLGARKDDEGQFVLTAADISERVEQERLKTELISTISHEIRTPLTSIRGALGLISTSPPEKPLSEVMPFVDIAESNAERLILLINDMLDLDKMGSDQLDIPLERMDLNPCVRALMEDQAPYLKKFDVHATLNGFDRELPILGNPQRVSQILINLLSNAAKFGSGKAVEINASTVGGWVTVDVVDHGQGVPEDFQSRIFDRFTQADGSDSRAHDGSGLGLAISKALAQRMNGDLVLVESRAGRTVFRLSLPAAAVVNSADEDHLPIVLVAGHATDDSKRLAEAFAAKAFATKCSDDMNQTVVALEHEQFAALVLGGQLADREFFELLQRIQLLPGAAHLPILVMPNTDRVLVSSWLQKPLRESEVVRAVGLCIERHHPGEEANVLVVGCDRADVRLIESIVGARAQVQVCETVAAARHALKQERYCVCFVGFLANSGSPLELAALARQADGEVGSIVPIFKYDYQLAVTGNVLAAVEPGPHAVDAAVVVIDQMMSGRMKEAMYP